MTGGTRLLSWLGRIGGRAHLIALASLVVLGLQGALLVYGLNRGFEILSQILVRGGQATEAVDELATDLNTIGDSIVGVLAGVVNPADIGQHVLDRSAAIPGNWPSLKWRIRDFVDDATFDRAQETIDQMPVFAARLARVLRTGSRADIERLQEDWSDLQGPLAKLVNRARARVLEGSDAARADAERLRQSVSAAEGIALAAGLIVLAATWYLLVVTIARPVRRIASTMTTLAEGKLDTPIPARDRRDEIGEMAGAIEVFRAHAVERDALLRERADAATKLERLVADRTAELRRRGAQLDATFDNMAQGILLVDGEFRIQVHNQRFAELWRLSPDVLAEKKTILDLARFCADRGDFAPRPMDKVLSKLERSLRKKQPYRNETRHADGTIVETRGTPLIEGGHVLTYTDVTEQRRAEDEIRAAKEAAEAANNAKSSFLATMTHELRTPMNGVLGILELLRQTRLDDEQKELTDVIGGSAEALLKIIDDILDLSKIEAGKMEVERVPLALLPLVEGVADTLASHAHRKKLSFNTYVDPALPTAILGDPVRLRQVLFNLIGNAIKFTEAGSVTVQVTAEGAGLQIAVIDTGIGLDDEARQRLFNPFVQADGTTTRRFGGTGLGLSICRRLVDLMDGTIGVDSVPGQGSTFKVDLPLAPADGVAPLATDDVAGLAVLVVEDDPVVRRLLDTYLGAAGAKTENAATAEIGLSRLTGAPDAFDVVIVDLKLPGRDGFAFRADMAADPKLADVKTVLLTAYNDPAHRRQALALGYAAFLTKPVRKASLLRAIAVAAGRAAPVAPAAEADLVTAAAPSGPAARYRVLVAEDNATNQMVILRQLATLGHAAELAGDGKTALDAFHERSFDLLLTDCHMPEMDGYELSRIIREHERMLGRPRMPIIALTAAALQGEAERCYAAGMDDYLAKPVNLARLDETLRRWLQPGGGAAIDRAPAAAAARPDAGERAPFDLSELRQVLGEYDERTRGFLRQFLETTGPLVARIGEAIAARDGELGTRASHTAKGAARSIMAIELAQLFSAVEECVAQGDWAGAQDRFAQVGPAWGRAEAFVARL